MQVYLEGALYAGKLCFPLFKKRSFLDFSLIFEGCGLKLHPSETSCFPRSVSPVPFIYICCSLFVLPVFSLLGEYATHFVSLQNNRASLPFNGAREYSLVTPIHNWQNVPLCISVQTSCSRPLTS